MRKEDFFEVLGELDDDIVKGAEAPAKKKPTWKLWGTIAACLALACAAALFLASRGGSEGISQGVADAAPMVYVNDTLYRQSPDERKYSEYREEFRYLGRILSDVTSAQESCSDGVPKENFQANHPIAGCELYQYGESVVVKINGSYWLYVKLEQSR